MAEPTDPPQDPTLFDMQAEGEEEPIRVLLLDDQVDNLLLRATILHKHGYQTETASTVPEALSLLQSIDVAVLDYHLGAGQFGTEVAAELRRARPEVPIIILSATLERRFGGPEDMHLLKGYSSVEDLVAALRSFRAKRAGRPVMVDARDWFSGKNMFFEMPELAPDWREIIATVATTRETYIDRTFRGLMNLPRKGEEWVWNVLAFPMTLHNNESGVVLTARILERKS
jgi:two-component system OmpR family response regulator